MTNQQKIDALEAKLVYVRDLTLKVRAEVQALKAEQPQPEVLNFDSINTTIANITGYVESIDAEIPDRSA